MTLSLRTPPLSHVLQTLEDEARASQAALMREIEALSPRERDALFATARTDYRAFYARTKDAHLAVSPATGQLLYVLARAQRARSIVEFGTSFGVSTLYLAAALADGGGGRLITTELEPAKAARARQSLVAATLDHLVEIREGDALETLARDLPDAIDLVLLDGAKVLYPAVLARLEPRLRPGALVVADNADQSPEYLAKVRSSAGEYVSVPFAGDVEVSMRALAAG